jgi:fucose permease
MNKSTTSKVLPVLFGFFIMGFCDVVGITSAHVKNDFGLSDTMSNMIPVALFSMFLLFSIPTGILMNKIGRKRTVLASNVITIIAMFLPLIGYSFAISLVAFALLGIANTILQVSLNPLLTNVVKGNMLTSNLTAGQFIKAISSFSAPFIAVFATEYLGSWQMIFPIYAGITVLSTIWLMSTPIEELDVQNKISTFSEVFDLLKDKTIFQLFLGILFVVGVDVGLNTVASKVLMERCGLQIADAGYGSSIYFAFRTIGAFTGTYFLAKFSSERFFKINVLIAILAIVVLIFTSSKFLIFALYGIIGFSISNVFPIIYAHAIFLRPNKTNEISGLMITGVIGGAIIPVIMGLLSDAFHSQVGALIVILISSLYLLYCAFVVAEKKL